jgi:hypothetical protein
MKILFDRHITAQQRVCGIARLSVARLRATERPFAIQPLFFLNLHPAPS